MNDSCQPPKQVHWKLTGFRIVHHLFIFLLKNGGTSYFFQCSVTALLGRASSLQLLVPLHFLWGSLVVCAFPAAAEVQAPDRNTLSAVL